MEGPFAPTALQTLRPGATTECQGRGHWGHGTAWGNGITTTAYAKDPKHPVLLPPSCPTASPHCPLLGLVSPFIMPLSVGDGWVGGGCRGVLGELVPTGKLWGRR